MKLLFVILTLRGGGAEGALVNLVNNLNKSKFDITVLSIFNTGGNIKKLSKDVHYKYCFKHYIPGNVHWFKLLSPKVLYSLLIHEKYDVVFPFLQGVATRIASGCDDNSVLISRVGCTFTQQSDNSRNYRSRKEMLKCYDRFDKIVGVSKDSLQAFSDVVGFHSKLDVMHNIYDTDLIIQKSNEDSGLSIDNCLKFVTTGTLYQTKGYLRLLACFKKLSDEGLEFHLYIIGDGVQKELLANYVNQYLKDKVTLLGFQTNPYKFEKHADWYICSSYDEGFSNAVAEAMILGVPVITTDCCGMREMLGENNEYGIIVKNSDEELLDGLRQILTDSSLTEKYTLKVKERGQFFLKENSIKRIENYFETLVREKHVQ